MEFDVKDYRAKNGRYYVREFLTELASNNPRLWAATVAKIKKLNDRGYHWGIIKPLKKGLYEIKPRSGSDTARVFLCFGEERVVWLLFGIVKKDKRRQQKAIDEARKLMDECKRRSKNHER